MLLVLALLLLLKHRRSTCEHSLLGDLFKNLLEGALEVLEAIQGVSGKASGKRYDVHGESRRQS